MIITSAESNGKHYGTVSNGDTILFRTPGYYTEGMALAAAKCWLAFHGEESTVSDALERARQLGLAMRAKMEADNTVTVSSGTHVVPWNIAEELRKPVPNPRNGFDLSKRMLARQRALREVATVLGISHTEARKVPAMLRANRY